MILIKMYVLGRIKMFFLKQNNKRIANVVINDEKERNILSV